MTVHGETVFFYQYSYEKVKYAIYVGKKNAIQTGGIHNVNAKKKLPSVIVKMLGRNLYHTVDSNFKYK